MVDHRGSNGVGGMDNGSSVNNGADGVDNGVGNSVGNRDSLRVLGLTSV